MPTWLNNKQQCDLHPSCGLLYLYLQSSGCIFSVFAFPSLCSWKLPPQTASPRFPSLFGKGNTSRKLKGKGLSVFHSAFLYFILASSLLWWNYSWLSFLTECSFCLQALSHHPSFICPSTPGVVMLPTFASIWVSLHHMLLSPNPAVTTVSSSFSKASLFWLSRSLDHTILIMIEKFHWV